MKRKYLMTSWVASHVAALFNVLARRPLARLHGFGGLIRRFDEVELIHCLIIQFFQIRFNPLPINFELMLCAKVLYLNCSMRVCLNDLVWSTPPTPQFSWKNFNRESYNSTFIPGRSCFLLRRFSWNFFVFSLYNFAFS